MIVLVGVGVTAGGLVAYCSLEKARSPPALDAALRSALSTCDAEGVRRALSRGADPNVSPVVSAAAPQADSTGVRPLAGSSRRPVLAFGSCPSPDVLQAMVDGGADLTPDLRRLADRAMRPPRPQVLAWLLDNGLSAQTRWPNAEGWETLCHRAARSAQVAVLRVVLDAGADPNGQDSGGLTPLARLRHDLTRTRANGARPQSTHDPGNLAFDPEERFADVIAMLQEAGGTE
ncbi:ankyrin repeat domain-containing protein [Pararhodobacter zhoushanensis]|uniref:Ankyrin repeat domain-containing protein n=1 Tax=Pararhodobacter zhoushanensis TaxID=2479545 RepID=A0ABT3H2M2_9RHOB|nr:ankyrin repeat domain-containing protein [Pararhodobacter zhoushanensis]MCW1934026.1 ankyrin repeat domain-containing protein [Pararhodobacter zhoushanensis]